MVVREGWLLKRGEHIKNWRARYFVLMEDGSLLGFKQKPLAGQYRDPTNNFTVKGCQIVKVESPTHFIFIIKGLSPDQEIERNFSAGNDHDRDSWCNTIIETAIRLQQQQQSHHSLHIDSDSEMTPTNQPTSSQSIGLTSLPSNETNTHMGYLNQNPNFPYHSPQGAANLDNIATTSPLSSNIHHTNIPTSNMSSITNTSLSPATQQIQNSNTTNNMIGNNLSTNNVNNNINNGTSNNTNSNNNALSSQLTFGSRPLEYVQQPKKMSLDDFPPIRLIGRGSWGKVMLSRERSTGCLYAVKILKKHVIISQNEVSHTLTESRVLRTTNHPFLIALKYSFRDKERLCFVMEYAAGGELFYHLSHERKFSEDKTRFYGAEIVSALGYLHEHDIIYRDLKLENLLLDRDGHIKIADFGLCKDNIRFTDTTKTFCGTPEYLSPEVIEDNQYGRAVDWWSLGVLLYEMMCGMLPFNNRTTEMLFQEILIKQVCFPPILSEPAKHFLHGLLIKDPNKRLGGGPEDAREIMIHPFFRGLNWRDLLEKKIQPPFVPEITSDTDTRYFDRQFTTEPVNLTPIDRPMNLTEMDSQSFFTHFSFAAGSQLQ